MHQKQFRFIPTNTDEADARVGSDDATVMLKLQRCALHEHMTFRFRMAVAQCAMGQIRSRGRSRARERQREGREMERNLLARFPLSHLNYKRALSSIANNAM